MCLAIPMKIVRLTDDSTAEVELDGVVHSVNVRLIGDPKVGEFVIVHAGFAIERLNTEEADARLRLFDELAAMTASDAAPPPAP